MRLSSNQHLRKQYFLRSHEFLDQTSRLDFFNERETTTLFLNWDSAEYEKSMVVDDDSSILRIAFYLDSKLVIHKRKIYGLLDFLADSGGVYESLFLLGSFLYFLLSEDILSIKLLEEHYNVTESVPNLKCYDVRYRKNQKNVTSTLTKRRVKLSCLEHLILGTRLRLFLCSFSTSRYCGDKYEKIRLLEQTKKASDRALDLRTTLKV